MSWMNKVLSRGAGKIADAMQYVGGGVAHAVGFEPAVRNAAGRTVYNMAGLETSVVREWGVPKILDTAQRAAHGFGAASTWDKVALGITVGGSALNLKWGYDENGAQGMWDAAVWDVAAMAAITRFGYRAGKTGSNGMAAIRSAGYLSTFGKAMIGTTIGQAVGGTPGAFIGGYAAGAVSMSGIGLAVGLAGAGPAIAAGATYYGAYQLAKMGNNYTQSQRRIDTSGDMSAFMTKGAMTMRARAVQSIHKSHQNSRSALGMEGSLLHTNRNYFSQYR